MHTLYKATFSDTVISERHTARDIHSNITQKSNSGMSASTMQCPFCLRAKDRLLLAVLSIFKYSTL